MKKYILIITYCIVSLTLFFLALSCNKKSEPEKPKRLSDIIALSIKEHTSDWTFTPIEEKHSTNLGDGYSMYSESWENKKCNIKLISIHSFYGSCYNLVSPDTMTINDSEGKLSIYEAYFEAIELPKIKNETRIRDSLEVIKQNEVIKKEEKIIAKLCK